MRYLRLKETTWHYARNYPRDVRILLGRYKLQQTLQTSDLKVAKERAKVIDAQFEDTLRRVRQGVTSEPLSLDWGQELKNVFAKG